MSHFSNATDILTGAIPRLTTDSIRETTIARQSMSEDDQRESREQASGNLRDSLSILSRAMMRSELTQQRLSSAIRSGNRDVMHLVRQCIATIVQSLESAHKDIRDTDNLEDVHVMLSEVHSTIARLMDKIEDGIIK